VSEERRREIVRRCALRRRDKAKVYAATHREGARESARKFRKKFPEKATAWVAVWKAVRAGVLKRPEWCPRCGVICKPQAHHYKGYDPQHRLDIIWSCQPCHKFLHRKEG